MFLCVGESYDQVVPLDLSFVHVWEDWSGPSGRDRAGRKDGGGS